MIRHVEATWDELGRVEPHWSVITNAKFRAATIGENKEEFFGSGKIDLETMRDTAARYGIRIEDYKDCFELGCGVGRVTPWLAGVFPGVIAADISAPHLEIARETIAERRCQNVRFDKLDALVDLQSLPEFDVFFSVIVLQHNPPPVIAQILTTIFRKLRPNGIGYFQIHTFAQGYKFIVNKYLDELVVSRSRKMEMHVLPQDALFALIEECGCQLLEIREDGQGGPTTISNRVLVKKRH
jgi:SAM-dependent methyltransferase